MYSRIFLVVASRIELILKKVLMDGSEARLIYCLTRCYNLSGRFIVVKAASVLSREKVLGRRLDLNLVDGEIKCDVFGEVLDLTA